MTTLKLIPKATEIPSADTLKVGDWYWVEPDEDDEGDDSWLGCIVHLGSNYAKLEGVYLEERVHFDVFATRCRREDQPVAVIDGRINRHKGELAELMVKIHEVTARLGVGVDAPPSDTQALATTGRQLVAYKKALVKAKDDELPALFKKVETVHKKLATWMTGQLIPLKAQSAGMKSSIAKVEERIFSVELYAGLSEDVVQVAKGKAASPREKLHLMQRMHFMDEECLVNYQAGGMTFESIKEFDQWLRKKENRDRLLPFPRCCIAFRVRRYDKPRDTPTLSSFVRFIFGGDSAEDRATFLYVRNGAQLYRVETSIDFGETLFPNTDRSVFGAEHLLAKRSYSTFKIVSAREHKAMVAAHTKEMKEWRKKEKKGRAEHRVAMAAWKKLSKREQLDSKPHFWAGWAPTDETRGYEAFDPSNLYYDDISKQLAQDIKDYNRIGLLLQGLFDRSPVLHPHPKVKLWTAEGFDEAIKLIYDKDRALHAGPKPDFKAYQQKLNASLKKGSVTVGQQTLWLEYMAETHREAPDYANVYQPMGDPGPGGLARVEGFNKRSFKVTFRWKRERSWRGDTAWKRRHGYDDWDNVEVPGVGASFTCEAGALFNVDAYTPGDYKQFFEDPRTRADYLQWAPLLLTAEDYHAGKRKVGKR